MATATSKAGDPAAALAAALVQAQAAAKAVAHDAANSYHGYRYTSAEAIIAKAKEHLAAAGLALVPTEQTIVPEGGQFLLVKRFALLHAGGAERPVTVTFPIHPDRGRPIDKATAGSATVALSYALRDILLISRPGAEDDIAARNDAAYAPPPSPPVPPLIGDKGAARLAAIAGKKGLRDLARFLPPGKAAPELTRDEANAVLAQLRKLPDLVPLPDRTPVPSAPSAGAAPGSNGR